MGAKRPEMGQGKLWTGLLGLKFLVRVWWQLPGLALLGREDRSLPEQSTNAVGPDLGRGMKPAKEPNAGKAFGQNVLEEAAHQFIGL